MAQHFAGGAEIATVAVAAGEQFPDALAGGRHAAGLGAALLMAPARGLLGPQADQVTAWDVDQAVVYGGPAALSEVVDGDLRRARVNVGAPKVVGTVPAGAEVHTLEQVVVEFDRDVALEASSVYVTLSGNEVAGTLSGGDFATSVIFSVAELPQVVPGVRYDLRIVGQASAGSGWGHFERRLTLVMMEPGQALSGLASWYGREFAGRPTACGERFDPSRLTLASRELACGTMVRITGPSGAGVAATVTDWGPARWTGRRFDLSQATFAALHDLDAGVIAVIVEVLA